MFCPSCGQQQITEDTRFCSRCGLLLTGVTELIYNGGVLPSALTGSAKKRFYQKKGFKQGLFIFLLGFLVVPIIAILSLALSVREPIAVAIAAVLFGAGGILRMIYSLLFETDEPNPAAVLEQGNAGAQRNYFGKKKSANALPPQQSIPATGYIPPNQGNWRDTNDLGHGSVIENTTKLLERDE